MKNKKMWLILGISAMIIAVAGAVAMAASSDNACGTQMVGQQQIMMEQMVKEGVISAEQAKTIQGRMSETMPQQMKDMPGMMNNMMGSMMDSNDACRGLHSTATPK